jgi:hypothetical protein
MRFRPVLGALFGLIVLSACAREDLTEKPEPLGDFALGLNIVVADNVKKVPISRDATVDEWEAAMVKAVDERFSRFDGTKLYNLGINVDAYALAPPGIPLVAAPKSVLVITANVWDDAAGKKLNEEGKQLTVFEQFSEESVVLGSGLTKTKEEQMESLSRNAARAVEEWLRQNPAWFGMIDTRPTPADAPTVVNGAPAPAAPPITATPLPAN